jgi:proteasome lid subunit RPN8/RPN11
VGEWHSHPNGYSATPSKDDLAALATLSKVMAEDARPAVMFIIAKKDSRILIG